MYRVIGPTAAVVLLVLFLVDILRMLLDIMIRAIAITIGKNVSYQMTAEAARLEIEDNEAQRLTIEEVDGPSAPKVQINNLDRLVNWSNEFLGRRDNDRVYPVPIIRGEQAARNSSTTVDMSVDEENNKVGQPKP